MDVVNLYDLAGHSPACFWIGGYESDPLNNVTFLSIIINQFFLNIIFFHNMKASSLVQMFSWNVSGNPMEQYFTEWESGYPKNRYRSHPLLLPSFAFCFSI